MIVVPFVRQHPFEFVDVPVALLPHRVRHEALHAYDEHLLVVTAVEHSDLAVGRARRVHAPQVVLGGFATGRHFEAGDVDSRGVQSREDRPNGAVLAGGVARLQDQQQAALALGGQPLLQLVELDFTLSSSAAALSLCHPSVSSGSHFLS